MVVVLAVLAYVGYDGAELLRTVPIDVLCVGIHVQVQLKDARHVVEK
jgi:hypothetical protein